MKWIWKITRAGNASDRRTAGTDRAAFDAWDRSMKQRLGWRAGLAFWTKTNTSGRLLVSRHWPHKLCWSWSLAWEPYRGAVWDGKRVVGVVYGYRSCTVHLAICRFRWAWQDYGDMVASCYRAEAPVVRYPWGGIGGGEKGRLPRSLTAILDADA